LGLSVFADGSHKELLEEITGTDITDSVEPTTFTEPNISFAIKNYRACGKQSFEIALHYHQCGEFSWAINEYGEALDCLYDEKG
jgi:hypothetical protein